jgi:hypothetical protein
LKPSSHPKYANAIICVLAVFFLSLSITGCGGGDSDDSPSTDATLSALTLSSGTLTPTFQSNQTAYTASVDFAQSSITVTPTATDSNATITVNGTAVASGSPSAAIALAVGSNAISVVVTAEDGTTTETYSVDITRAAPSTDATLSGLTLSSGVLEQVFQSSQLAYTADRGYLQQSISVIPVANDANATLTVNGAAVASGSPSAAIALIEGDTLISVVVTAQDGTTTQTYTVTVTRASAASLAQQAYLKASNAEAGDEFGYSVALSGDTLVVGAYKEDSSAGAAYVFTRSGGVWSQQAYLKASNAEAGDEFGLSVAISGDTLAVGAWAEDSSAAGGESDNSATDAGAAYVFTRSGTTWNQQAYLKASNAETLDLFGFSVALSDNTLVVGAYGEDSSATGGESGNSATNAGAAYVFTRSGTTWSQQDYLKADNAVAGDFFGFSVAVSDDTLVAGAYAKDTEAGAAYVFTRSGGAWSQQAYLQASNAEASDRFGYSVAISGDTLVVGADKEASSAAGGESDNSVFGAGAAYVFIRSGITWGQQAYLKADNANGLHYFGRSVSIADDTLVVGASSEGVGAGAAYAFTRSGVAWSQLPYLKASNAEPGDNFGNSVAISGDTLAVGAYLEDSAAAGGESDNSAPAAGAAYTWQ